MRAAHVLVAGAIGLVIVLPAAAQEFKINPNLFGQKTPAPRRPNVDRNWQPSADQNAAAKPAVICGMTVIPADPKVDPKIKVAAPDRGVAYTMRTVEPTICKAPQK